jgi:predicted O-methyltransferase YrrM
MIAATMTTVDQVRMFYGVTDAPPSPIRLGIGKGDLPRLFQALGFRRGAELGVWAGGYSEVLCRRMPGLELYCVDPWAPYAAYRERKNDAAGIALAYAEAQRRLQPFAVTFLRMPSRDAAAAVPDASLDFVYIDANHERAYVEEDLATWTGKVRPGGVMAGHDYRVVPAKPYIEVKAAVDAFVATRQIDPWFLAVADRTPSYFWVVA